MAVLLYPTSPTASVVVTFNQFCFRNIVTKCFVVFFLAFKVENFIGKILMILICLFQKLIVDTY